MVRSDGWSRRGFLTARGLAASTGGAVATLLPQIPLPRLGDDRSAGHWKVTRRAMACDFTVHLHPLVREPLAVANAAFREIEELEDLLTVYRPGSEMSRVNQQAFERPVRVDSRLFGLLRRAAELKVQTDGAFDVATGAMIKAWGFFAGPRRVPGPAEHAAALARCGMRQVDLDPAGQTVRYRVQGLQINLGSIGKGHALDAAIRRIRQDFGVQCALITGGNSSLYAIGSLWGDDGGWLIGIEDPGDAARTAATVRLRNRAMGTSSTSNQFFEAGGQRYGHLLDPRTGWPADQVASASCLAPDAATADALATAFFVLGLDKTAEFCQNHPDIAAVLVLKTPPGTGAKPVGGRCGVAAHPANGTNRVSRTHSRVVTFNLSPQDVRVGSGGRPSVP